MADEQKPAEPESVSPPQPEPSPPTGRSGVRVRFPVFTLLLAVVALGTIWTLNDDLFDRGTRMALTYLVGLATFAFVLAWFLFFSGIPWRVRIVGTLLLMLIVGGAIGSVRRLEFTGDMAPIFTFRWQPTREALLEAYREKHDLATPAETVALPAIRESDMAEYRGVHRDGVVIGPALLRGWDSQSPNLLWRRPVGGGYASMAVTGDVLVTIEQRGDEEAVVCYDAETGREQWVYEYPTLFSEPLGGDGPRATPTISGGKVYSLGANGLLACLDAATGEEVWKVNILAENAVPNVEWGMCSSPLVYDGWVVVNPGAQKGTADSQALWALDAETGRRVWSGGTTPASYGSPMLATLDGVRQVLQFDAYGLVAYDADGGTSLWKVEWKSDFDINAGQPVLLPDDRVFISSSAGSALFKVSLVEGEWQVEELWRNRNIKASYANVIYHDGFLYGLDNGILVCLNAETGERAWKKGRYGNGQMLLTGDLLVILSEKGELALVEATPEAFRELGRIDAIEGRTWNNHALVDGKVYVRNHLEMACYELPLAEGETKQDVVAETPPEEGNAAEAP